VNCRLKAYCHCSSVQSLLLRATILTLWTSIHRTLRKSNVFSEGDRSVDLVTMLFSVAPHHWHIWASCRLICTARNSGYF